jgi:hypothetical protein
MFIQNLNLHKMFLYISINRSIQNKDNNNIKVIIKLVNVIQMEFIQLQRYFLIIIN